MQGLQNGPLNVINTPNIEKGKNNYTQKKQQHYKTFHSYFHPSIIKICVNMQLFMNLSHH